MDVIPAEYIYYCFGAFTIYVITSVIKKFYNIKDIDTLEFMEENKPKTNRMKKTQSMNVIMERPVYLKTEPEINHIEAHCLDIIPKDNKYVNLWLKSLLANKNSGVCASPNCLNKVNRGGIIFMAFDSQFCSDRCRCQAQNYLGRYWNISK